MLFGFVPYTVLSEDRLRLGEQVCCNGFVLERYFFIIIDNQMGYEFSYRGKDSVLARFIPFYSKHKWVLD